MGTICFQSEPCPRVTPDRLGHLRAWEAFAPLELVQGSEAGSWGCNGSLCCNGRKPIQRPKKEF